MDYLEWAAKIGFSVGAAVVLIGLIFFVFPIIDWIIRKVERPFVRDMLILISIFICLAIGGIIVFCYIKIYFGLPEMDWSLLGGFG